MGKVITSSANLSPVRVATVLLCIALFLTLISLLGMYAELYTDYGHVHRYVQHIADKINVNSESNIPTFYSVLLLLTGSILCWLISRARTGATWLRRRWAMLAFIFLLLSMEEAASFHDLLNISTLKTYLPTNRFLRWTWVIPGGLLALTVFMLYIPFLRALPRRTAGLILLAGVLFVGGAVGFEMIESAIFTVKGGFNLSFILTAHAEELLEMVGVILFIYALLDYIEPRWLVSVCRHGAVATELLDDTAE